MLYWLFFFRVDRGRQLMGCGEGCGGGNERRSGVVVAGSVAMECPADRVPGEPCSKYGRWVSRGNGGDWRRPFGVATL